MTLSPQYKAIKAKIAGTEPVFRYLGQYLKGKENTSYKVPATYIETPKNSEIIFFNGKRILAAKNVQFKIHYISNAPFKNHDNTVQEAAIEAHEARIEAIDKLITGFDFKDTDGRIIMQQLIPVKDAMLTFMDNHVVSVITYVTEVYNYR